MPDYRRRYVPGADYAFTVCLRDWRSDLLVRKIEPLRAAWVEAAARRPFETIAAVVLPNHLHTIWRMPEGDSDYSTRWADLKAGFTRTAA
jgi:putative transposase